MSRARAFDAVVADMDGVLTRTARLHERAWKRVFDPLLERHGDRPFSSEDYRAHVDGKPRYDGVADFLAARDIEVEEGAPDDPPDRETVYGIGNRKNAAFGEALEAEGVETFPDAVAALDRWRRGGLALAVVSSSKNCRRVLDAADLTRRVDAIVDGRTAEEEGMDGKPDLMTEAARRLGVGPQDAVVLEDAEAGVRAGVERGFGRVVGVDRGGAKERLEAAGATEIVQDIFRLRFPRRLPSALDHLDEIPTDRLAVFLDFDGTLAPIVDDPGRAGLSDAVAAAIARLADRWPVAVVSGRDRADVEQRVGLDGIYYAGSHGFDIAGRGRSKVLPEAEAAVDAARRAESALREALDGIDGAIVEPKRFSVAAHYRKVEDQGAAERVEAEVRRIGAEVGLRVRPGKCVLELEPDVDWDKGRAIEWMLEALPELDPVKSFVVYVGDDETDEDAFAVLANRGFGIYVGEAVAASRADYRVPDPDGVRRLAEALAKRAP